VSWVFATPGLAPLVHSVTLLTWSN